MYKTCIKRYYLCILISHIKIKIALQYEEPSELILYEERLYRTDKEDWGPIIIPQNNLMKLV